MLSRLVASPIHTVLVELLEAHPEALAYLLEIDGSAPSGPLVPTSGTRTKTFTLERRVDRAFVVGSREAPTGFVLTEIQLDSDDDKLFSWSLYVELARSRYRCEGALVVLTVDEAVRRWIDRAICPATGQYGASRQLRPRVLALDSIEPALLLRPDRPYLAPLAVAGGVGSPHLAAIAASAVDITIDRLPKHLATEQLDGILAMVDEALRARLESRIMERHEYRSELFRGIYRQGETEGEAKGKAEGRAEGKAEDVLVVLSARGISVGAALKKKILACSDVATLDTWLRRAAVVSTAAAVLHEEPTRASPKRPARRPPSGARRTTAPTARPRARKP